MNSHAGVQAADAPIRISGVNKRGWKYIKESQKKLQDAPKVEAPVTELLQPVRCLLYFFPCSKILDGYCQMNRDPLLDRHKGSQFVYED